MDCQYSIRIYKTRKITKNFFQNCSIFRIDKDLISKLELGFTFKTKTMKKSRRQFLETSLKLGIGLPLVGSVLFGCDTETEGEQTQEETTVKPLKILILGGTSFLGPHQIAYAISRGHSISTFTRGKSKPMIYQDLFENVEQLIGDRENDLEVNPLKGKKLSNVRASGTDEAVRLTTPIIMSLEEAIAYIDNDELVEVTPKVIRLRKIHLDSHERKRAARSA
jgi:hypothetical protein